MKSISAFRRKALPPPTPVDRRSGGLPQLDKLDRLLEAAVVRARAIFAAGEDGEMFRGLYISEAPVIIVATATVFPACPWPTTAQLLSARLGA